MISQLFFAFNMTFKLYNTTEKYTKILQDGEAKINNWDSAILFHLMMMVFTVFHGLFNSLEMYL